MVKFVGAATLASLLSLSSALEFSICRDHILTGHEILIDSLATSPSLPSPGDSLTIAFSGRTLKDLNELYGRLTVDVLGINVESQVFNFCNFEGVTCPISAGAFFEGSLSHELHLNVPEGVEISARLQLSEDTGSAELTCVETEIAAVDSSEVNSPRFGFDPEEVDYLFNKWVEEHRHSIYVPHAHRDSFGDSRPGLFGAPALMHLVDSPERKNIFQANLLKIATHNAQQKGWTMGMNQFGHLTNEEFKNIYASGLRDTRTSTNLRIKPRGLSRLTSGDSYLMSLIYARASKAQQPAKYADIDSEVNWVKKGAVTPVKNQGACGSCWSFATTGALEGAYFVKHKHLVSFSEQELVACDHVDMGCSGGSMDSAYQWIEDNGGLCTEDSYPYTAAQGVRGFCTKQECKPIRGSRVDSIVDVDHSEMSLEEAVMKNPVAVAIEADQEAFQFYSGGVLTAECSQNLDHGVLLVGYGTDTDETTGEEVKYWLIKNSWGPNWGDEGYIKLVRGTEEEVGGECGVLLSPSYPVLK